MRPERLTFGLMLDPEYAFNILDKGPSADSTEVKKNRISLNVSKQRITKENKDKIEWHASYTVGKDVLPKIAR